MPCEGIETSVIRICIFKESANNIFKTKPLPKKEIKCHSDSFPKFSPITSMGFKNLSQIPSAANIYINNLDNFSLKMH